MFIANLDAEKQKAFLNLAYTMIYADGRLDAAEKKLFYSYMPEVDVDLSEAHTVDFKEELAMFDNCTVEEKLGVFYELYALALVDKVYAKEEKVLIDIAQEYFGVTEQKMSEMRDGLQKLINIQDELRKIVYSD